MQYIGEHFDTVTLAELAEHFSYHPNYISTLLTKELGKSFSELVLEQRMERAAAVLRGTQLPVSEIATRATSTKRSVNITACRRENSPHRHRRGY